MSDLMGRFFGPPIDPVSRAWAPPLMVEETDDNVLVHVELPGIDAKTVDVTVEDRELTIKGERKPLELSEKGVCLIDEIGAGSFVRRLALSVPVTTDKTSADYKNGMLHITLPKADGNRRKKIAIHVTGK